MTFRHTITRLECPEHGSRHLTDSAPCCNRPWVERTYVAVDALLDEGAVKAARKVAYSGMDLLWTRQTIEAAIEEASRVPS